MITIELENGKKVTAKLYPDYAPNTVKNFLSLARSGFYDGLIFHRVIPGFMIQGGCPDGTGMGGPGYSIRGEFSKNGIDNPLLHKRGVLSMAHRGKDTGGSQFFICHNRTNTAHLDGVHTCFGRVVEGLEVIDQIRPGDLITGIDIIEEA